MLCSIAPQQKYSKRVKKNNLKSVLNRKENLEQEIGESALQM